MIPYYSFDSHWFNNYWCGVSFHVLLLFYTLWVQFTSWNWLIETWPCLVFFSDDVPQDISWGQVSFKALSNLWLLRALQHLFYGFPAGSMGKNPPAVKEIFRRFGFDPWVGKIRWRRKWQLTPVFLPGESHRQRSLAGYSPWDPRVRHNWVTKQQQQHLFLTYKYWSVPAKHSLPTPTFSFW